MPTNRFIAHSRVMRALVDQVRRFARTDSNVLIAGETGTGKNAVAYELHARSPRAAAPFVTVDCAALSATLIDSELFGHERGAFTHALAARAGRFEVAAGGTVFLDAVTELPLEAQGKLLRIVEDKRVERLGGSTPITVTARVVASADAGVEDLVVSGSFRSDLYHRLRVLPILVPPLRERPEDVLPLGHAVERALQAADGAPLALDHLAPEILEAPALGAETALARRPTLDEVEARYIAATLRHTRGNQTDAAKILGISRKALWEKRKRYGIE
ncbi:MAG: sigma-54-dependent Fis family transcriptional regulator [Acidobacteria bacterium]|nr:sigma-54-dependent Fis family transcriptional regulator [Acidobacteriota bacterium]